MTHSELPYFGSVDVSCREPHSDVRVRAEFDGHSISLDLNFDGSLISTSQVDGAKAVLERLPAWDQRNKEALLDNYDRCEGGAAKLYAEHHLFVCVEECAELLNLADPSVSAERRLIGKLRLKRVGIYPYDEKRFFVFDYIVDRLTTDYLIAITRDQAGQLSCIAMES